MATLQTASGPDSGKKPAQGQPTSTGKGNSAGSSAQNRGGESGGAPSAGQTRSPAPTTAPKPAAPPAPGGLQAAMTQKDAGQPYAPARDRHSPAPVGDNYAKIKQATQPLRPGETSPALGVAAGPGAKPAEPPKAPAPVTPDPEQEWKDYCGGLKDAGLQGSALALTGGDRLTFKALKQFEQRVWGQLDLQNRTEFLNNEAVRKPLGVIVATPSHLALYQSLTTDTAKETFRTLTPDERGDLVAAGDASKTAAVLNDGAARQEWQTWRTVQAFKAHPDAAVALGLDPTGDPKTFADEVQKLSIGWASERLRRLVNETGFENPADRDNSMRAVRDDIKGGKEPTDAFKGQQSAWVMKGKLTKNEGQLANVPLLKACAWRSMVEYGTCTKGFRLRLFEANQADPRCPKLPDGTVDGSVEMKGKVMGEFFANYRSKGGAFSPDTDIAAFAVRSGNPYAYWMYDQGIAAVISAATAGIDVMKACAIEESPEYAMGFTVVQLPPATAQGSHLDQIRRPTVWDGLAFDQFAAVDDPSQCHGVTTGGTNEVVVGEIDFKNCTRFKEFAA